MRESHDIDLSTLAWSRMTPDEQIRARQLIIAQARLARTRVQCELLRGALWLPWRAAGAVLAGWRAAARWRKQRRAVRELNAFDDRTLRDIGLGDASAVDEVRRIRRQLSGYGGKNDSSHDRRLGSAPRSSGRFNMSIWRVALVLCCLALPAIVYGLHAQAKPEPMALTPSEMKWETQGGLAMAGIEQAKLMGDPSKSGPYTVRLKFPARSEERRVGKECRSRW